MKEAEKLGDCFVFLSDPEGKLADLYAGRLQPSGVFRPATIVVGKEGKIVFASALESFAKRPPADLVLEALKKTGF